MKYVKPNLYFVSTINANARCANGSTPTLDNVCTEGPQVSDLSCTIGWGNYSSCNVGNAAGNFCEGGANYGGACFAGGADS